MAEGRWVQEASFLKLEDGQFAEVEHGWGHNESMAVIQRTLAEPGLIRLRLVDSEGEVILTLQKDEDGSISQVI